MEHRWGMTIDRDPRVGCELAPVWEKSTGQLVTGGTRVRLSRAGGASGWIQFATPEREEIDWGRR